MLPRPLDWSLMVPARPPTPCKSTKSRLPDAEITKGRRSLHTSLANWVGRKLDQVVLLPLTGSFWNHPDLPTPYESTSLRVPNAKMELCPSLDSPPSQTFNTSYFAELSSRSNGVQFRQGSIFSWCFHLLSSSGGDLLKTAVKKAVKSTFKCQPNVNPNPVLFKRLSKQMLTSIDGLKGYRVSLPTASLVSKLAFQTRASPTFFRKYGIPFAMNLFKFG